MNTFSTKLTKDELAYMVKTQVATRPAEFGGEEIDPDSLDAVLDIASWISPKQLDSRVMRDLKHNPADWPWFTIDRNRDLWKSRCAKYDDEPTDEEE